jgi:hypothetical protein
MGLSLSRATTHRAVKGVCGPSDLMGSVGVKGVCFSSSCLAGIGLGVSIGKTAVGFDDSVTTVHAAGISIEGEHIDDESIFSVKCKKKSISAV